jgi:hypothetical protein
VAVRGGEEGAPPGSGTGCGQAASQGRTGGPGPHISAAARSGQRPRSKPGGRGARPRAAGALTPPIPELAPQDLTAFQTQHCNVFYNYKRKLNCPQPNHISRRPAPADAEPQLPGDIPPRWLPRGAGFLLLLHILQCLWGATGPLGLSLRCVHRCVPNVHASCSTPGGAPRPMLPWELSVGQGSRATSCHLLSLLLFGHHWEARGIPSRPAGCHTDG